MAKAKRRSNSSKKTEISRPSKDEDEIRKSKIVPLIQKLSVPESADRLLALSTMTSMAEDSYLRLLLKKEKLLPILINNTLKDPTEEIVTEAYGLIRNFLVEEGYDLAFYLLRQGILPCIKDALNTLNDTIFKDNMNEVEKENFSCLLECTENILGLLAAMVPTDNHIFDTVNQELPQLPRFLVKLLNFCKNAKSDHSSLLETVLELSYIMTEANQQFLVGLGDFDFTSLTNSKHPSARVYAVGILYNQYIEKKLEQKTRDDDNLILSCLTVLVSVIRDADLGKAQKDTELNNQSTNNPKQANEFASIAAKGRSAINAVQTSLEIIAAIAETLDVEPETLYGEEDTPDEEQEDEEMDDAEFMDNSVQFENDIKFDSETTTKNKHSELIDYLLETVIPIIRAVWSNSSCESRAHSAINNIIWALSSHLTIACEPYKAALETLWEELVPLLSKRAMSIDSLISITGSLWGIAKAFNGQVPLSQVTTSNENFDLVSFIIDIQYSETRILFPESEWIKYSSNSINLLASLAACPDRIEVTKKVSEFLFSILSNLEKVPASVMADTLNAVFDIFGDKEYPYDEELFVNAQLLQVLKGVLPSARKVTKKVNKKTDWKLRQVCDQACINLARFIDYKEKERD